MKNGWEPGGPLLTAWVQVRIAIAACPHDDCLTRPIMNKALYAAHDALEEARLEAIRRAETNYLTTAIANARAQAASVADPVTREELRESWDEIEPGCGHGLGWPDVTKE